MKEKVWLTCLNPQGAVDIAAPAGLTAPRVKDLAGKKVGIFWDGKKGGDNFCIALEEALKKKYPTARFIRLVWGDIAAAEKGKREVDTFVFGVGDAGMGGWGQCRNVMDMEKLGKPGIFVVGENAIHTARMSARDSGMPGLRIVSLPSIDYYPNRSTVDGLRPVVESRIGSIIDALTLQLTPEEKNPSLIPPKEFPAKVRISAGSYEAALDAFNRVCLENHWGDGLPLVPPTKKAVKRMLSGTKRIQGAALTLSGR